MDLLIPQGFWVDKRQETGGGDGGPAVARIPVSGAGSWLYRTLLSLKEAVRPQEVALLVHSLAHVHPVLPAARGTDVRVPYWLSQSTLKEEEVSTRIKWPE